MGELDGIIDEFVQEGNDKANQVERHLIQLEKDPGSRQFLTEIFRAMHSIKGAASFLGFPNLCTLTHTGESLLSRMRDGSLAVKPEIITALLSLVDAMRNLLSEIESTGHEGNVDHSTLISLLTRLAN